MMGVGHWPNVNEASTHQHQMSASVVTRSFTLRLYFDDAHFRATYAADSFTREMLLTLGINSGLWLCRCWQRLRAADYA